MKQAVELLLRGTDVTARERELMRAVPEMDTIAAMLGVQPFLKTHALEARHGLGSHGRHYV